MIICCNKQYVHRIAVNKRNNKQAKCCAMRSHCWVQMLGFKFCAAGLMKYFKMRPIRDFGSLFELCVLLNIPMGLLRLFSYNQFHGTMCNLQAGLTKSGKITLIIKIKVAQFKRFSKIHFRVFAKI